MITKTKQFAITNNTTVEQVILAKHILVIYFAFSCFAGSYFSHAISTLVHFDILLVILFWALASYIYAILSSKKNAILNFQSFMLYMRRNHHHRPPVISPTTTTNNPILPLFFFYP